MPFSGIEQSTEGHLPHFGLRARTTPIGADLAPSYIDSMQNPGANFYRDSSRDYPVIDHADGVYVYDDQQRQYLDFGAGIGVTSIGYSVPEVTRQIAAQLEKVTFVFNGYFTNNPRIELAEKLLEFCPDAMSGVIFASSGSEASEVAIKIARQYHREAGNESKWKVISRQQGYHGNTMAALSASGREAWRDHFEPYVYDFPQIPAPYCYRCPLGLKYPSCNVQCARELEDTIKAEGEETVSAFIAEPVCGTTIAGVTPPPEYYDIIREICNRYNVLFIADEVLVGLGRTGRNMGIDHWDVVPDIIVVGKGLAAGYAPLSAVIVSAAIEDTVESGSGRHTQGFTYSGNPLSCSAGLAVLTYIQDHDLVAQAAARGDYLRARLEELQDLDIVGDIRGVGLFLGLEFVADRESREPLPAEQALTGRIVSEAMAAGLILIGGFPGCVDGVRGDQLQISPAFVISEEQIDEAIGILRQVLERVQP